LYGLPSLLSQDNPCFIICWVIPGNPYPVVEGPGEVDNVDGKSVKSGYQCHYVLIEKKGCPTKSQAFYCDELVVGQENQILPAFVLKFTADELKKRIKNHK